MPAMRPALRAGGADRRPEGRLTKREKEKEKVAKKKEKERRILCLYVVWRALRSVGRCVPCSCKLGDYVTSQSNR